MTIYKNIFSPLKVKNMTLKNRIIMPPMGTNFAGQNGEINEEHIKYYEQRAKGGTGLIIVENVSVQFPLGSNGTTQLRIDIDSFMPSLYELTERLHKYGTCVAIQINHSGASAVPERIGCQPVSSSNIPSKTGGAIPRPLEKSEILDIIMRYGKAARRVQIAGFDAVEIHAGHSYLISQFLSPIYNNRQDEFGGNFKNRARFARMVIDSVRAEVGPQFPIMLRVSADELLAGGNSLEDTLKLLEYLNDEVDIFDVSAGLNDSMQYQIDMMSLDDGWRSYMSKAVREKFNKPTITTGNIRDPQIAERILESGDADLIGIGRGLIADPNWVEKVENGEEDVIRKCISCNIGCAGYRIGLNRPIRCTVNPDIINENIYKNKMVKKQTNVVVIGGGTAGLEAAGTAAELGCTTFLFEQKAYLGGLAREISKLPDKHRISYFPDYLLNKIKKFSNFTVFTNTKPDVKMIENLKPDIIVNATGSKPLLPPIKGLLERIDKEGENLYSIFGMLKKIDEFKELDLQNKKVAVIGGGAVGLDVVEFFAERKAKVSIVEMMPMLGRDLDVVTKVSMMAIIKDYNVEVNTSTALIEVASDHFKVKKGENEEKIDFDYGFVCLGMKPVDEGLKDLQEHFSDKKVEIINIGDSTRARKIMDGVREGSELTLVLEKIGSM
ncbi:NAD(P)/FAD-dependent oxidoreductase [Clostridium estertheticum]|uniref:NAD(P)/FAD-dependent oxidoreductase n=1 Tax=Clostridium estertheticum TaxID=238834 RepID=UPI001C7D0C35|nr:NAD(P)/FAD-dependent oxidoreductase [Clostridium estertheticum]MBX4266874.1 NAD(P)/FAD-dependent oxidoreductase [Clostridium estertheticum]WLC89783.1 NAD(P)/FAD-dependent oxidoreductase [Clostridium estertheticum]